MLTHALHMCVTYLSPFFTHTTLTRRVIDTAIVNVFLNRVETSKMATGERRKAGRESHKTNHDVKLSKKLSYVLRHGAIKEGYTVSASGFVDVGELLKSPKFQGYGVEDLRTVVDGNDKQRFHMCEDEERKVLVIRANQGHSFSVPDLDLTELQVGEIPFAIHGTYKRCCDIIKREGLSRMGREHIHMAVSLPGADGVISGMRSTCDVIVRVNIDKALADGLKFYKSSNGVILCPGNEDGRILPKYFDSVKSRQS